MTFSRKANVKKALGGTMIERQSAYNPHVGPKLLGANAGFGAVQDAN